VAAIQLPLIWQLHGRHAFVIHSNAFAQFVPADVALRTCLAAAAEHGAAYHAMHVIQHARVLFVGGFAVHEALRGICS
jgi:hypothetical protein